MPETPDEDVSYGEHLRRKNIQARTSGWSWRTRDQVDEWRTSEGARFKRTTDQAGHETTQETTPDGRERQHVRVNLR